MPLIPQFLRSFLFIVFALFILKSNAQNIDLKVKASIVTATGKLSDATVKIFKNGILDQKFNAGSKGKFSFFLEEPNTIYVIEISAENHVPSKIEITTWVPEDLRATPYTIVLESFELLQCFNGLNYKILRDPVLKFSFSNEELNFTESYRASQSALYQDFYTSYKEKINANESSIPFEGFQAIAAKVVEPTFEQALNQALFYINKKEYTKAIELLKKAYNKLNYDEKALSAISAIEEAMIQYEGDLLSEQTTESGMRLLAKEFPQSSGELLNALKLKKLLKTTTHDSAFSAINVLVLKGDLKKVAYDITELNTLLNEEVILAQKSRNSIDAMNGKELTYKQSLDQVMVLLNNREYSKAVELLKKAYNKLNYDEKALNLVNALEEAMVAYNTQSKEELTTLESAMRMLAIEDLIATEQLVRIIQNRPLVTEQEKLSLINAQIKSKKYSEAKTQLNSISANLPEFTIVGSKSTEVAYGSTQEKMITKELSFDESCTLALQYINKRNFAKAIEVLKNAYRKLNHDEKALDVLNAIDEVLLEYSETSIERTTIESALRMLAVNEVNAADQIIRIVKRKSSLETQDRGAILAEVNKYIEKGDFKKAKELIDKLYRKLPSDSTVLSLMKTVDEQLEKEYSSSYNNTMNLTQGSLKPLAHSGQLNSLELNQLLGHVNNLIKSGAYKQAAHILDSLYKKLPTDATILNLLSKVDLLSQEDLYYFLDTISNQVSQAEYKAAVIFYNNNLAITELLKCNKTSFNDVCNILEANNLPKVKLSHFKIHFYLSCGYYTDALEEYAKNLEKQKHQNSNLIEEQNVDFIIDFMQEAENKNSDWANSNEQKINELEQDSFYNQTIVDTKAILNRVDHKLADEPSSWFSTSTTALTAVASILIVFLIIVLRKRTNQKQKTE